MCRCSDMLLNCVSTYIERSPEFRQLLIGISTNRYFPPSGTAGLARSLVSGNSRVPAPPPMMIARVRWVVPGGSAGVCIVANVTVNGIAARKIFAGAEYHHSLSSRTDVRYPAEGRFPKHALPKMQPAQCAVRKRLTFGGIPRRSARLGMTRQLG